MKQAGVSTRDHAERPAQERDVAPAGVRDVHSTFGTQESEFERLQREQDELLDSWRRQGIGIDLSDRMTREEVNDRRLSRLTLSDAYR